LLQRYLSEGVSREILGSDEEKKVKIILGIKSNGKVVYLETKEIKDSSKLSALIELIKLFFKHNC